VRRNGPIELWDIGLIAALYYASAKLGLSAGFLKGNVTAVWPPSGFALAVLVLYGSRPRMAGRQSASSPGGTSSALITMAPLRPVAKPADKRPTQVASR